MMCYKRLRGLAKYRNRSKSVTLPASEARAYLRLWLRTPASTLPTRFPAALDIGHGLPAA